MAEISDAELTLMRRAQEVLAKLNGDSRTRGPLEAALKVHYPDVETEADIGQRLAQPHIEKFTKDVVEPLTAKLTAIDAERTETATRATAAQLETAFDHLKKARGFTEEGIEKVKGLMVDRSIADPMAAAALFNELNPPQTQEAPGWTPQHWNYAENASDHDIKGLFANEDVWADKMAAQTLNEIRLGKE